MTDNLADAAAVLRARSRPAARRRSRCRADEARHLTRVLRLGDRGRDRRVRRARARVPREGRRGGARAGAGRCCSRAIAARARSRACPLTLVQAVLKGDKMDDVVRDATMMGVAAIEPIVTTAHIARTSDESGRGAERWSRVAIASAKQCRRATVPAISRARPYSEWLAGGGPGLRLILVEPSAGAAGDQSLHLLEDHAPATLALLVGPEGGWSADERDAAEKAGCFR